MLDRDTQFEVKLMASKADSPIFNRYYKEVFDIRRDDDIIDYTTDNIQRIDRSQSLSDGFPDALRLTLDKDFGIDKQIIPSDGEAFTVQEKCPTDLSYGTIVVGYNQDISRSPYHTGVFDYLSVGYPTGQGDNRKFDLWTMVDKNGLRKYLRGHNGRPLTTFCDWRKNKHAGNDQFLCIPIMTLLQEQPEIVQAIQYSTRGLSVLWQQWLNHIHGAIKLQPYDPDAQLGGILPHANRKIKQYLKHKCPWITILDHSDVGS